jgi:hypothetical protein
MLETRPVPSLDPLAMPAFRSSLPRSRGARRVVLAAFAAAAAVVALAYYSERAVLKKKQNTVEGGDGSRAGLGWWKVEGPGVIRPPAHKADEANLSDDEEVIGIEVGGKARAYRTKAFADPSLHIVNDLIDDQPVTVTYCDLKDCARAYVGPRGNLTLDVSQAGLKDREMVIKVGGDYYWQRSGLPLQAGGPASFPYKLHPLVRMKWGEWKRQHPQSEVYLGQKRQLRP